MSVSILQLDSHRESREDEAPWSPVIEYWIVRVAREMRLNTRGFFWSDRGGCLEYERARWTNCGFPVNSTRKPGNDGVSKVG